MQQLLQSVRILQRERSSQPGKEKPEVARERCQPCQDLGLDDCKGLSQPKRFYAQQAAQRESQEADTSSGQGKKSDDSPRSAPTPPV